MDKNLPLMMQGKNRNQKDEMYNEWEGWDAITLCPFWRKYGAIVEK